MIRFFDASALVKRYVREAGTDRVGTLLDTHHPAISRFSLVDITSALTRRTRQGDLSADEYDRLIRQMDEDTCSLLVVEVTPAVVGIARHLLRKHPLRAGDALQIASCLFLKQRTGIAAEFVGFDRRQNDAARGEGLDVVT